MDSVKTLLLTCLFAPVFLGAQKAKREIFLNEEDREIGRAAFDQVPDRSAIFFKLTIETDTATIHAIERRLVHGSMDASILTAMRDGLAKVGGPAMPPANMMVIVYLPGLDRCNKFMPPGDLKKNCADLAKKLAARGNVSTFFVVKQGEGLGDFRKTADWLPDPGAIIERTFFSRHYLCESFLVVRPDGRFIKFKGQNNDFQIIEALDELGAGPVPGLNPGPGLKPQAYFDHREKQVSKQEFELAARAADGLLVALQFDLDSVVVNVLEPRLGEGKLTEKGLADVRAFLKSGGKPFLHGLDKVAIVFYHQLDAVNSAMPKPYVAMYEKSTRQSFKHQKIRPVARFFVHRPGADLGRFKKMGKWRPDTDGLIESMFFPLHCPGFSTVFILPNGNFYLRKGGPPAFFLGAHGDEN